MGVHKKLGWYRGGQFLLCSHSLSLSLGLLRPARRRAQLWCVRARPDVVSKPGK